MITCHSTVSLTLHPRIPRLGCEFFFFNVLWLLGMALTTLLLGKHSALPEIIAWGIYFQSIHGSDLNPVEA